MSESMLCWLLFVAALALMGAREVAGVLCAFTVLFLVTT